MINSSRHEQHGDLRKPKDRAKASGPVSRSLAKGKKSNMSDSGDRYEKLKEIIRSWWKYKINVALALKEIKEGKLYKADGFDTFEAFCETEFSIKRSQMFNLLAAAEVKLSLGKSNMSDSITNARQASALAVVPPENRVNVLRQIARAGRPVTAKAIREAAAPKVIDVEPEPTQPERHCATCTCA